MVQNMGRIHLESIIRVGAIPILRYSCVSCDFVACFSIHPWKHSNRNDFIKRSCRLSEYSAVVYIEYFLFVLPSCMNVASSIRVGILVGEDNINRMKKICLLTTSLTLLLEILQISVLLAGINLWGKIFISNQEVAHGIVTIIFVIAAYQPIDGALVNFQGILIGIGKQWLGIVFPIAFFIIAIPSAILLTVVANLGPLGYWMGIMIAFVTRALLLIPLNLCCLNWSRITSVI